MFRFVYANQNTAMNASAARAEAASCCGSRASSFSSFPCMNKMGAIAMASILAFMPVLRGMILPALVLSITLIILLYTVFPYTEQER